MKMFRKHRRLIAFIASVVMLLAALAPAISHAMSAGQGGSSLLMEICSANGNKTVQATKLDFGKSSDSKDSKQASQQHCSYCITHAQPFALLPPVVALPDHPDLSYALPELFFRARSPLFAWAAGNPRAPPFTS